MFFTKQIQLQLVESFQRTISTNKIYKNDA